MPQVNSRMGAATGSAAPGCAADAERHKALDNIVAIRIMADGSREREVPSDCQGVVKEERKID